MYYHFSTTTSLPFINGRVISRSATIGLESSSEEIELSFQKFYCFGDTKKIPLYVESSISEDLCNIISDIISIINHNAVLLVDDLDFFITLLHDSKFQRPEEELNGSFCILDDMSIHWISDENNIILATIQKVKEAVKEEDD